MFKGAQAMAGKGAAKSALKAAVPAGIIKPAAATTIKIGIVKPSAAIKTGIVKPGIVAAVGKAAGKGKAGKVSSPAKAAAADGQHDKDVPRMVHCKNIPFQADFKELKQHMAQAGGTAEFAYILKEEWSGRSRGSGFVRFATEQEAHNAVAMMNGSTMRDKEIACKMWEGEGVNTHQSGGYGKGGMDMYTMMMMMMGKGGGKGTYQTKMHGEAEQMVYIGDLAQGTQWKDLKAHMGQAGTVEFVNVRGKMGQVRFSSAAEAQNAISSLNGSELGGQTIMVDVWTTGKQG